MYERGTLIETEVVTVTYTGYDYRTNLEFSLTKGKIPKAFKIIDLAGEAQEDGTMIFNIIMLDELAYGRGKNAGNNQIGNISYKRIDTIPTYIAQSGRYYLSTTQLVLSHFYSNIGFAKNHTYQLTCYYWD